jgi:hypothetical protein
LWWSYCRDFSEIDETLLQPVIEALKPIADVTVESQVKCPKWRICKTNCMFWIQVISLFFLICRFCTTHRSLRFLIGMKSMAAIYSVLRIFLSLYGLWSCVIIYTIILNRIAMCLVLFYLATFQTYIKWMDDVTSTQITWHISTMSIFKMMFRSFRSFFILSYVSLFHLVQFMRVFYCCLCEICCAVLFLSLSYFIVSCNSDTILIFNWLECFYLKQVNSNEWHLDTSVAAGGRSKVLQLVVYITSALLD